MTGTEPPVLSVVATSLSSAPTQLLPHGVCRDRYGRFNSSFFPLLACSLCFNYLFPGEEHLVLSHAVWAVDLTTVDGDRLPEHVALYPDLLQAGPARLPHQAMCRLLGEARCERLHQCCTAAIRCCRDQIEAGPPTRPSPSLNCPHTWDGFACFTNTPAGRDAHVQCPSYLYSSDTTAVGVKTCQTNSTWWASSENGKEWTDYSACVNTEAYRYLYYTGVTLNITSLVCLLPACIIFLSFKQLLKQHRVRIHLNLFLAFIVTNASGLWWEHRVFLDRLDTPQAGLAFMHSDTGMCRFQYILTRYSWSSNFAWMSLEALHLYRLINQAFKPPKSITSYYLVGWLLPCVPIGVYCVIREVQNHPGCWVANAGELEWILYGPNLLCVSLNVMFLVIILKVLLTQLQSHPNEPSNYRRALKATCILVPLFGLQFFLYVYRPFQEGSAYFLFEVFAKIINNSQGATVAIVFCFFNSEVHTQFRSHVLRSRSRSWHNEARSFTFSTEGRRVSAKGSNIRLECIPLTSATGPPLRDVTSAGAAQARPCRVHLKKKKGSYKDVTI